MYLYIMEVILVRNILIIDDDVNIGNMIEEVLIKEGYIVSRAYSGTEALLHLNKNIPNLILLDLMLPGISGEELLSKIKGIPIIVVSAKVDINNKVDVLLGGAVDYITKPFSIKELLARITVQFRKESFSNNSNTVVFDDIIMDTMAHVVTVCGTIVKLTKTEYAILKLLIQNPLQVITKSILLEKIGEDTPDCVESSLKVHISNLRKKPREVSKKDYIEAVWGIGFKMRDF